MSRFHFRLDRVLDLRASAEQEEARTLNAAATTEDAAREASEASRERLRQVSEQAAAAPADLANAGTMRNYLLAVRAAESQADDDQATLDASAVEREAAEARYHEARRARRVLERLREHRHAEWNREANRQEQRAADDLAPRRGRPGGDR